VGDVTMKLLPNKSRNLLENFAVNVFWTHFFHIQPKLVFQLHVKDYPQYFGVQSVPVLDAIRVTTFEKKFRVISRAVPGLYSASR
jgi:hypothetical protein